MNGSNGGEDTPVLITLLMIIFSVAAFLLFCGGTGVMIDAIVAFCTDCVKPDEVSSYTLRIVPVAIVHIFFFIAFCLDGIPGLKKSIGESYREDILGMFLIVLAISSVELMALASKYNRDIDGVIAMLILPCIGIVITPKRVKNAINKIKEWEESQRNNNKRRKDEADYKLRKSDAFAKQLYWVVFKHQFKNLFLGIGVVIFLLLLAIHKFSGNTMPVGRFAERGALFALVTFIMIAIFGIPVFVVFMTTSICRLKLVKNKRFQAYHVIAKRADDKKLVIEGGVGAQQYEYPVCVGIRKKDVHDTKAVLVLLPDLVMIFPEEMVEI